MPSLSTSIESIDFQLLFQRGIFWPEQQTLFVADTHFGKEATFRSVGVPVPQGSTLGTLATIAEMICECKATRLILLGDMFHARSSISPSIENSLDAFFAEHPQLRFTLVVGNHDRHVHELLGRWPIEIVESGTVLGCISISHFPMPPSQGSDLLLCGHLHPAYRSHSTIDSFGKLPCFWLSNRQLVLPAIGEFTGTQLIKPLKGDRTWVIAENQIIELLPNRRRQKG